MTILISHSPRSRRNGYQEIDVMFLLHKTKPLYPKIIQNRKNGTAMRFQISMLTLICSHLTHVIEIYR